MQKSKNMIWKKWAAALAVIMAISVIPYDIVFADSNVSEVTQEGSDQAESKAAADKLDEAAETEVEEAKPEVLETEVTPDTEEVMNPDRTEDDVVTGMDEDGNIYEVEESDGLVEENMRMRASGAQVVNFYTKSASKNTSYTEDATKKSGYTNGAYGADAAYLGTSSGKVKFMLGGVIGWVSSSEVQIIYKSSAKSISHYKVSSGKLYHYISTNMNNSTYGSTILMGTAPSYLSTGKTYYSYDGHYFYTDYDKMLSDYKSSTRKNSVNASNPFYNYFQYLPLRSSSNYTSSEMKTLLNRKVSSTSKLRNTGNTFVSNQDIYGTNTLLMIGIAANESAWGASNISQSKNNLFGLNAVDSSPGQSANYYSSVTSCIKDFSETYLSKRYLRPGYTYYNGGYLGDKASGMNVSYASDPYWGEKAAAAAWNLDNANGNKDSYKYSIGIKNTMSEGHTNLIVLNSNSTSSTVLYQSGSNSHYAFLVLSTTATNGFYKVQSDGVLNSGRTAINTGSGKYNYSTMYAYASSSHVTIVSKGTGSSSSSSNNSAGISVSQVTGVKKSASTTNSITVTWGKVSEASGYIVYRSDSPNGTYSKIGMTNASTLKYKDTGRAAGRQYYYKVKAYKSSGGKDYNGKASGRVPIYTTSKSQITVQVTANLNLRKDAGTAYGVMKTIPKGKKLTVICTTRDKSGSSWYKVKYTVSGKSYTGYISANHTKKVTGSSSAGISVSKVTGVKKSASTTNSITVTWGKVSGAAGYIIYRSNSPNGTYSKIGTTKASTIKYKDTGRAAGRQYYYKVKAYKTSGGKNYNGKASDKAPIYTISKSKIKVQVTANLNLRKDAGTAYGEVITIPKGKKLTVICTTKDKSGSSWYKVKYTVSGKSYTGYISAKYTKKV